MEFPGLKTVMKALPSFIGHRLSPEIIRFKRVSTVSKVGINPLMSTANIDRAVL